MKTTNGTRNGSGSSRARLAAALNMNGPKEARILADAILEAHRNGTLGAILEVGPRAYFARGAHPAA